MFDYSTFSMSQGDTALGGSACLTSGAVLHSARDRRASHREASACRDFPSLKKQRHLQAVLVSCISTFSRCRGSQSEFELITELVCNKPVLNFERPRMDLQCPGLNPISLSTG